MRSAEIQPGRQEHIIAAVREHLYADDLSAAEMWMRRVNRRELREEEQAEAELLLLEIQSRTDPTLSADGVHARLREIAARFPAVELVQENLALFASPR